MRTDWKTNYDLDDDGDGQTDELEIRLGLIHGIVSHHAYTGMVTTLDLDYLENEQYQLRGKLLADGRASPIEYGFILTSTDRNSTLYTVAADENGKNGTTGEEFSKVVEISIVEKVMSTRPMSKTYWEWA